MRINTSITVLLAAFILASCAPTATVQTPTETRIVAPTSTSSLVPATVTTIPATFTPENLTLTPEPAVPLSAKGPWLLYVHNTPQIQTGFGVSGTPAEFVIMNQDGSGRISLTLPDCGGVVDEFLLKGQNLTNYMAEYKGSSYLFRPAEATGMQVYGFDLWYSACGTFSNGDEKNKLLASRYWEKDNDIPVLMIYELPSGKIRDRIPLVKCAKDAPACEKNHDQWGNMSAQTPDWSPNGRYLAFAAVLDSASSDLFLYDSKDGKLRRLTNGPDWVGPFEWSPDGTQIIMNEIADHEGYFPDQWTPATSLWSVSLINNEIKLLYLTKGAITSQTINWVDDKHFFAYEGFLTNADQARNLRWVDTVTGTNRIVFQDDFGSLSFDPIHQIFALFAMNDEKYPDRYYLVSVKDSSIHSLAGPNLLMSFPSWDSETGLFVSTYDHCENDPQSLQAVDHLGNFKCVAEPTQTPVAEAPRYHPAPNGKLVISVEDGIWLEAQGQTAVQISPETASEVIWCPKSDCFFFFAPQEKNRWNLYRVSVPDLTLKMVDEGIESIGSAQWLGADQ